MNPEEEQTQPAASAGAPGSESPQRRGGRGGRGRGRGFGRGGRGGRERSERPPAGEAPRAPDGGTSSGGSPIHEAIREVERIRGELNRVVEDMNHVLHILDQAEKEKNVADDEIDKLRQSLRSLHHSPSPARYARPANSARPAGKADEPVPESEPADELD